MFTSHKSHKFFAVIYLYVLTTVAPAQSSTKAQLSTLLPDSVRCCDLLRGHDENILLKTGLVDGTTCDEANCFEHARMKLFISELGVMLQSCTLPIDGSALTNTTKLEACDSRTLSDILTFAYIGRHWTTMGDVSSKQASRKYFEFDSEFDRLEPRHIQCEFNEVMYLIVLVITVIILLFTLTIDAINADPEVQVASQVASHVTDHTNSHLTSHFASHIASHRSQSHPLQPRSRKSVYEIIGSHMPEHHAYHSYHKI